MDTNEGRKKESSGEQYTRQGGPEPCIIDYGHGKILPFPVKSQTYMHLSGTRLSLEGDLLESDLLKAAIGGGVPWRTRGGTPTEDNP